MYIHRPFKANKLPFKPIILPLTRISYQRDLYPVFYLRRESEFYNFLLSQRFMDLWNRETMIWLIWTQETFPIIYIFQLAAKIFSRIFYE